MTYVILFGFKLHPFFGKTVVYISGGIDKGTPKHRARDGIFKEVYFHNCTTAPEAVREEVGSSAGTSPTFWTRELASLGLAGTYGLTGLQGSFLALKQALLGRLR